VKECGTCSLCCKVYDVPVFQKAAGTWCRHFSQGIGCSIHENRPDFCKSFFCNWIYHKELGPEWKPDKCRFVLTTDPSTKNILVEVDPGSPSAWRKEPYYSAMKNWAKNLLPVKRHVAISIKKYLIILLPDEEVSIGILGPNEILNFSQSLTADSTIKVTVSRIKRTNHSPKQEGHEL
jgi:hypothetical protein